MANYCNYEIHVCGAKKAALFMYACLPAANDKEIIHEEGTEDSYTVWIKGDCKWELDAYCEERPNVEIDLSQYSEEDIRSENCGYEYRPLTVRQKSEVLGLKVLARSWSGDSGYEQFDVYDCGKIVSNAGDTYTEYPDYEWDKDEFPTYAEFCEKFGIDPNTIPEEMWEEDDEGVFYCNADSDLFDNKKRKFTFEF